MRRWIRCGCIRWPGRSPAVGVWVGPGPCGSRCRGKPACCEATWWLLVFIGFSFRVGWARVTVTIAPRTRGWPVTVSMTISPRTWGWPQGHKGRPPPATRQEGASFNPLSIPEGGTLSYALWGHCCDSRPGVPGQTPNPSLTREHARYQPPWDQGCSPWYRPESLGPGRPFPLVVGSCLVPATRRDRHPGPCLYGIDHTHCYWSGVSFR